MFQHVSQSYFDVAVGGLGVLGRVALLKSKRDMAYKTHRFLENPLSNLIFIGPMIEK